MCKKTKIGLFVVLCAVFIVCCLCFPYGLFMILEDGALITTDEFYKLKTDANFCVNSVLADDGDKTNEYFVNFNLFNLFNIKKLKVNVVKNNEVFVGGDCVGLSLKSKGVVIVGSNYIITEHGNINPINNANLKTGDIIVKINEVDINTVKDIQEVLTGVNGEQLSVIAKRNGAIFETKIKPELDVQTNSYKLGLWIKEDAVGVGTLTFIKPDTLRYGALGHAITDADSGEVFEVSGGEIYKCNVVGIKKGVSGNPGEILGFFMQGKNIQGNIDKNNEHGAYGNLNTNSDLVLNKSRIRVGGRLTAKPGKATILTCVNGVNVEEFDIELIKTDYVSGGKNKSMVIKVVDQDLINKTGGIVQGMSGSPIIQNGKIVGAVTHVFVNDPTKGFGLYLDWMINE